MDTCSFTIYTEIERGPGIDFLIYFKNIILEREISEQRNPKEISENKDYKISFL